MNEARQKYRCPNSDLTNNVNNLELVHLSGKTQNNIELKDIQFGVVAHDSYRLKRKVEMFLWHEIAHRDRWGIKHFTYQQRWSQQHIDSN